MARCQSWRHWLHAPPRGSDTAPAAASRRDSRRTPVRLIRSRVAGWSLILNSCRSPACTRARWSAATMDTSIFSLKRPSRSSNFSERAVDLESQEQRPIRTRALERGGEQAQREIADRYGLAQRGPEGRRSAGFDFGFASLGGCARIGRHEAAPRAYAQPRPFDSDVDLQELARPLRRIAVVPEEVVPAVVEHDPAEAADDIARS